MLETPNRDRHAERREATKREILDEAWGLAREKGLAGLSLRELAGRVGMRAPSLYSYFDSKDAIYDAMFAEGFRVALEMTDPMMTRLEESEDPIEVLFDATRSFMAFCTDDPVRYQLLFQRTIPGFEPSAESYEPSVEYLQRGRQGLAACGIEEQRALDLYTALLSGLSDQQISNDPGGDRWLGLVDEALEMYLDHEKPGWREGRTST